MLSLRTVRRHWLTLTGALFVLTLVIVAITAPVIAPHDPLQISSAGLAPPSKTYPLGTDELGHDMLSALIYGTRVSLIVGFFAALASTVVGSLIGMAAGYYGDPLDMAIMRISEVFQVLPSFILAAVIVAFWGPGLTKIILVIVIVSWPQTARLMRGEVLRLKGREFVDAARCLGASNAELMAEILPNAVAPVVALGTLIIAQAILLEAGLSFLGLSNPDVISWGSMLNEGQRLLFNGWWLSVFPGTAIFATVLAFNLLGDGLNSLLNRQARG